MTEPRVFLGSSTAALPVARAIQSNLKEVAHVEIWDEPGVFELGEQFMTSLSQALGKYDFAVIVMTPEDEVRAEGANAMKVMRDNVLIELGLFVGGLGRDRTFLVCDDDPQLKIPDDIKGLKFASYSKPRDATLYASALKSACAEISHAITQRGRAATLRQIQESIQRLARYSMSSAIFDHLCGIAILHSYIYRHGFDFQREMNFLRDNGLIQPRHGDFRAFDHGCDGQNLVSLVKPTPIGLDAVRLRRDDIKPEWLTDATRPNLREDPRNWT